MKPTEATAAPASRQGTGQWTLEDLKGWVRALLSARRVVAPVSGPRGAEWAAVRDPEQVLWEYGRTVESPREWLIPRTEPLFAYDLAADPPSIEEIPLDAPPTVILLARPCDVHGLRALDPVMRWDYTDESYEERRKNTVLVALGCSRPASEESCFCGATGIDARWAPEADVMIEPIGGGFRVAALTEAGRQALASAPKPAEDAVGTKAAPQAEPVRTLPLDLEKAREWLRNHFDDPFWDEASAACLGCGTCAYLCPGCHCFDVVDDGDWRRGRRVRNWDACAFSHFTQHASGHNPRPHQWNRYRQRVFHKFVFYPDKFGRLLCTGCGRCVEACPAGVDLIEILKAAEASA